MATSRDLLTDAFTRIRDRGRGVVEGLSPDQLNARLDGRANSITWLVWHLARVQDDHVAEVAGTEQVWTARGWVGRFDLPFDAAETGYGHDDAQVQQARVDDPSLLTGYLDEVADASLAYVAGLDDEALDRVVDERWDPPVTLAVRLVSVVEDDLEHLGQAAFARGLVER
ncbi:DUF664 domain-containing protein [Angustibacter peucedani]